MNKLYYWVAIAWLVTACAPDEEPAADTTHEAVDRQAVLIHWADDIIVPGYEHYSRKLEALRSAAEVFGQLPDENSLASLRSAWHDAYLAWQRVAMFEIGPAEATTLRNFTNIYPTDAAAIEQNVQDRNYTFNLPSKYDEQGFPALDYLLFGLADSEAALLAHYTDAITGEKYRTYVLQLINRLNELTTPVVAEWVSSYRDAFVNNAGTSATGSINTLVNDYLFYYEKALRAGKVGIPAGVFSGGPLPHTVEGRYAGDISKDLLLESIDAVQDFFNGRAFSGGQQPLGLKDYLDQVEVPADREPLSVRINGQFDRARQAVQLLQPNFVQQIADDNQAMLVAYDALQANVVLMKVDMLQALNVKVDFVDADGD